MKLYHFILFIFILPHANANGQSLRLEPLNSEINTAAYDEIAPCVSADGLVLYFTRMRSRDFETSLVENGKNLYETLTESQYLARLSQIYSEISGKRIYNPVNSVYNQDIYIANTATRNFDVVTHPSTPINNALPNSISSIIANTNEVVLVNQFVKNGGMQKGFSKSHRTKEGEWSFPRAVSINNYHNSGPDVNLTMSEDGEVMILSLERADAIGKSDLYVSFKLGSGSWSAPKNLGSGVNTPFREATPHLSKDKSKLFFSSDRGQRDGTSNIYVQNRLDRSWQKWTAPRKFVAPINSKASDSHPYLCPATGHLYFCSNRNRNRNWDIYRVQIDSPKSEALNIRGIVYNKETMEPIENAQVLTELKGVFPTVKYTGKGDFRMTLPWSSKTTITVSKDGFESDAVVVETGPAMKTNFVKEIKFYLVPLKRGEQNKGKTVRVKPKPIVQEPEVGEKVNLNAIYFVQSKAIVRTDSYSEIDRLAHYLKVHPRIYIEVSGHTDNQGDEKALLKLSEERAEAIKSYLIYKQYINPLRISTKGYGSNRPLNDNATNKLREKNRRVEVEVTSLGK